MHAQHAKERFNVPENNDAGLAAVRKYLEKTGRKVSLIGEMCLQDDHGTMVRIPDLPPQYSEVTSLAQFDESMDVAKGLTGLMPVTELFTRNAEMRIWCVKPTRLATILPIKIITTDVTDAHAEGCRCEEALAKRKERQAAADPLATLLAAGAVFLVGT